MDDTPGREYDSPCTICQPREFIVPPVCTMDFPKYGGKSPPPFNRHALWYSHPVTLCVKIPISAAVVAAHKLSYYLASGSLMQTHASHIVLVSSGHNSNNS